MQEKIKEYLEWKATHHPRASISYRKAIERFAEVCGEKKLEEYTIKDVVHYTNWLSAQFANETVRYSLTILKNFFTFYKSQNHLCLSPKLIELPRKLPPNSHRAITRAEMQEMTSSVGENNFNALRDLAIIFLLWDSGVRVSELCGLNICDLDMEKCRAIIHTRKTSSARIILWSQMTHTHLLRYLYEYRKRQGSENTNVPLFVSLSRNAFCDRLSTRSIQRIIKNYTSKAKIEKRITPHSFRHGWAHARRDEGAPPAFIQKGLGHLIPLSSQVYQQYSDPEFEMSARSYFAANNAERRNKIDSLQHLVYQSSFDQSTK